MNKKSTSKKRPVVARKVEPVVGRSLDSLLALASSSMDLLAWMNQNCGYSDEWPIQIVASTPKDEDAARELASKLAWVEARVKTLKRNGPAFRALMGWQARKAYPPNTRLSGKG